MKHQSLIYSIGYGNRKINEFIELLRRFHILYLVDVRTQPYSKFNPFFNQADLKSSLESQGIKYVFMGDTLGGRPQVPSCYDKDGKVDYEILKSKDFFKSGIFRLKAAHEKNLSIVIMCSEINPCECHRSKLIGRVLLDDNIHLKHIDEKGRIKSQIDVINELNKGLSDTSLFPQEVTLNKTSRKSYQ